MVDCSVKARRVHDGEVWVFIKVSDKVLDALEHWCLRGSSVSVETFDSINKVRTGIMYNMEDFENMDTEFPS